MVRIKLYLSKKKKKEIGIIDLYIFNSTLSVEKGLYVNAHYYLLCITFIIIIFYYFFFNFFFLWLFIFPALIIIPFDGF